MKKSTKKRIAKEILIFFSTCLIIGLVILGIYFRNELLKTKFHITKNDIDFYEKEIDSIQNGTFINLPDLLLLDTTDIYKSLNSRKLFSPTAYLGGNFEKNRTNNIRFLYVILDSLKYDFEFSINDSKYYVFEDSILLLIENNNVEKLDRYYSFLLKFNLIDRPFSDFYKSLSGFDRELNEKEKEKISSLKIGIETKTQKFQNLERKINGINEQKHTYLMATIILLVLVYPLRLIYFLIKWAINTMKV